VVAILCAAHAARAQSAASIFSTQELYSNCMSADPSLVLVCEAYLIGVADVMAQNSVNLEILPIGYAQRLLFLIVAMCSPSYSGVQLRQIFINWAERNPAKWSQPQAAGAIASIAEVWPCR